MVGQATAGCVCSGSSMLTVVSQDVCVQEPVC